MGAGKEVMEVLAQRQCFNYLVAVTHWYGGQHLGPTRFQHIKDAANQAVSEVPQFMGATNSKSIPTEEPTSVPLSESGFIRESAPESQQEPML